MKTNSQRARQQAIVDRVNRSGIAGVAELAEALSAAEITIRRDIAYLSKQGLVKKVRGGAQRCEAGMDFAEQAFRTRLHARTDAKERLAQKAIELIQPGDAIFLGGSTTIIALAKLVAERNLRVTVFTNSLYTAMALAPASNVKLIVVGGVLDRETRTCSPTFVMDRVPPFNVQTAFISCTGFSAAEGVYDSSLANVPVKRMLAQSNADVVLVVDAVKLGRRALHHVLDAASLHSVVTGKDAPGEQVDTIRKQGLRIHLA